MRNCADLLILKVPMGSKCVTLLSLMPPSGSPNRGWNHFGAPIWPPRLPNGPKWCQKRPQSFQNVSETNKKNKKLHLKNYMHSDSTCSDFVGSMYGFISKATFYLFAHSIHRFIVCLNFCKTILSCCTCKQASKLIYPGGGPSSKIYYTYIPIHFVIGMCCASL